MALQDEPNCFNNFKCRFCDFDAAGIETILHSHYKEIHPVEAKKDEETEVVSTSTKKQPSLSKFPTLKISAYFSYLEQ